MDGFRWDYFELHATSLPNLRALRNRGSWLARGLEGVFPSKTFPSMFALASGLFAESNSIVGNSMYDPVFDATFSMGNLEPRWWNDAEPIWNTAVTQGVRVGTMHWVGSDVEIRGVRPTYWYVFDPNFSDRAKVQQILDWYIANDLLNYNKVCCARIIEPTLTF
jgi:ectonucleotide pyrophosphatase/phosphodiesterase family protein 5